MRSKTGNALVKLDAVEILIMTLSLVMVD